MKVYNSRYRVAEKLLRLQPGIYAHESEEDIQKLFCPLYKVNIPNVSQTKTPMHQSIIWDSEKTFRLPHRPLTDFEKEAGLSHRSRAEFFINHFLQHLNLNAYISRPSFGFQQVHTGNLKDTPRQSRERRTPAGTNETYLELIKSDFSFPGEMIFTDRKELLFDMNTNKNMRGFILITVNNLLTPEQCNQLNPFLISISTIENVPVSILTEQGFDRIYVQYNTPLFGTVQTNTYPIKKTINVQESRSFLTHLKDKLELINFAQSGHIIFQIRGIRFINKSKGLGEGALFGTLDVDFKINKPFTKSTKNLYSDLLKENEMHGNEEDRLLFVAEYTYKKSLNLGWISSRAISCTTLNNIFRNSPNQVFYRKWDFVNTIDINYSNEKVKEKEECFIEAKQLLEFQTILNVTMSISSAMSKQLLTILGTNEPLSRIALLIYDINAIIDLLTMIFEYNASLRTDNESNKEINMDCTKQHLSCNISLETEKVYQQFITGFYVDNGKTFYLFIEGSAAGFIHVVWSKIMVLTRKVALVWYNSDLVFTERLYSGMLPCTSIYGIVLKEPIEMLFQRSYTFLKGSMPIPCWEAVRKLNFLFMESTMLYSSTRGLFPSMEELISFDIEFGVPNKTFDPNIINLSTSALFS